MSMHETSDTRVEASPRDRPGASEIVDAATSDALLEKRERLAKCFNATEHSAATELRRALPEWRRPAGNLGDRFNRLAASMCESCPPSTLLDINRFVVAELALELPKTLADRNLPR